MKTSAILRTGVGAGVALLLAGCGATTETVTPTSAPATTAPTSTTAPATTTAPSQTPVPTATRAATATATPSGTRKAGQVDGIRFVVSSGSKATFTVKEQLARLPLPNEAVMSTSTLGGEVRLDGGASTVTVNLQTLSSDERLRDDYVRSTMFGRNGTASFAVPDLRPLPAGFTEGKQVTAKVAGTLNINGNNVPLSFDVEVRDDGAVVYVLGKTTFTWAQVGVAKPRVSSVLSVEDEVRVEVLLALKPA